MNLCELAFQKKHTMLELEKMERKIQIRQTNGLKRMKNGKKTVKM